MKKVLFGIGLILVALIATLAALPAVRDELHWQVSSYQDDANAYKRYLEYHPSGRHAHQAHEGYDERIWETTHETDTIEAYQVYLNACPQGAHQEKARLSIETLSWQAVLSLEGVSQEHAAQAFLNTFPQSEYKSEAMKTVDRLYWQRASASKDPRVVEHYMNAHPEGDYVVEARLLHEDILWERAKDTNTVKSIAAYQAVYPNGRYASQALQVLDTLAWEKARAAGTILACNTYLEENPMGQFIEEANTRKKELAQDAALYEKALQGGQASIQAFLEQYPGHTKEKQATAALADMSGRDITDLVQDKVVEAKPSGGTIQNVNVEMRRRVPHTVQVRIPAGTFFASKNASVQNMVATEERTVTLDKDDWQYVSVAAACANRPRDIPGEDDTFTIRRSPGQADLEKLIPILSAKTSDYAVKQAAVWIVTDNADYDDLGTLVRQDYNNIYSGTRIIGEAEAARAMRICDEAGVNIKNKAIWRDRKRIASALNDSELKQWLSK